MLPQSNCWVNVEVIDPRARVYAAFFIYAFSMGGIFPRLPDLQRAMGIAEGALGLALIGTATGTLISFSFASRLLERTGYRRALLALIPVLALLYGIAAWMPGPLALFLALIPAGLAIGAIEIIINLEADRVEYQTGRRIMNRAHGFWSLGFFTAGAVGALLAELGVSPVAHLCAMAPVVAAATFVLLRGFHPAPHRQGASTDATSHFARPTLPVLVLVMVALSALIMEGAGTDWSAIYMRDVFNAPPWIAGFAVAVGALTQALARFCADYFVERRSPTTVARFLLCVLGLGGTLVFAAPSGWAALLGFGLMGIGSSAIFPLAMSAAAQRNDRPAAMNVAALAQLAFAGFLLGPPLLGYAAQYWGIRWSFGIVLPLVLLSYLTARALTPAAPAAIAQKPVDR